MLVGVETEETQKLCLTSPGTAGMASTAGGLFSSSLRGLQYLHLLSELSIVRHFEKL